MFESLPQRILANLGKFSERAWLRTVHADDVPSDWTYDAFVTRALRWSSTLRHAGLRSADRVLILLPHGIDLYAGHCGALLMGAVPAVFGRPSVKHSFDNFRRSLVALRTGPRYAAMIIDNFLTDQLAAAGSLDDLPTPILPSALLDDPMPLHDVHRPPADAVAILQYSSGTTGLRKGLPLTHGALTSFVDRYAETIKLAPDNDRIVSWLPIYHDMGFIACYVMPLVTGCPLVAMSAGEWVVRPQMLLEQIETTRSTLCWLPNFAFEFLARNVPEARRYDLHTLRAVINSSETVRASSLDAFYQRFRGEGLARTAISTCYGMAENAYAVTQSELGRPPLVVFADMHQLARSDLIVPRFPDDPSARPFVSSGHPLPGVEVRLLAEGRLVEDEERVGELLIRSPWTFRSYDGRSRPDSGFDSQDYFHTGDLGFWHDGELFVLGRQDDVIIVGGVNVFPEDLESIASATDGIVPGRAVAFGVDDAERGTQRIVVLAETREANEGARQLIQSRLHDTLSRAIEGPIDFVSLVEHQSLIKSTSGKISRRLNREQFEKFEPAWRATSITAVATCAVGDEAPSGTPMPRELEPVAACVARTLQAKSSGFSWNLTPDMPLVTSGLIDSFSFVQLRLDLEKAFNIEISAADGARLERFDTIRMITAYINAVLERAGNGDSSGPAEPPAQPEPEDQRPAYRMAGEFDCEYQEAEAKNGWMIDLIGLSKLPDPPQDAISGLGFISPAEYHSSSLTTDDQGFRTTIVDGRPVRLQQFAELDGTLGFVLGDSATFGNGASHDRRVFTNVMNELASGNKHRWFNASLRASNLKGQLSALQRWDIPRLKQVLLYSATGDYYHLCQGLETSETQHGSILAESVVSDVYTTFLAEFERDLTALTRYAAVRGLRLGFAMQVYLPLTNKRPSAQDFEHLSRMRVLVSPRSFRNSCSANRFFWLLGRRFRADVRQLCGRLHVPFLDPCDLPIFNGSHPAFQDYWHYDDEAHFALGKALHDWWLSVYPP